jgi:outer membrane protein assembly factor BamB
MRTIRHFLLFATCAVSAAIGWAQGRNIGFEWPVTNADAQRTAWMRLDPNISAARLSKPGFEFLWREKLDNASRQSASLNQGVTMNGLLVFSPASFVTGASNNVFAIDNDTGFPLWHRRFDATLPAPTAQCPGGITGAAGRVVSLAPPALELPPPDAAQAGYRGGLGHPGEGVPMEIARRDGGAGLRGASPIPARRGGGGGVQAGRYSGPIYAISSAGALHVLGQSTGIDVQRPTPFLPANARYSDLTAVGEMLYTSTSRGCGGAANGVWAITLGTDNKKVVSWNTNGGSPVGNLAFTASGKLIVAIGPGATSIGGHANAIVALDAKTLQPTDWFTSPTAEFVTTPMIVGAGGREIVAAATRDGRIFLLDAASLGGANHSTPLFASASLGADFAPDALAAFEQSKGAWTLLAPVSHQLPASIQATNGAVTNGAIVAFRLADEGNKWSLQPAWSSRDVLAPTAPIVVNDVVFAAASGRPKGAAVLYAFDSRTGRELWNSGKTMVSYVPAGNLWASNSQVHAGTYDGTVYAFGFNLERRPTN